MKHTKIQDCLFYSAAIKKHSMQISEAETNVLLAIDLMNKNYVRCSCNTLFRFLSSTHHTQNNKRLRKGVKKLREHGLVRCYGKGNSTNLILTVAGQLYLNDLNNSLIQLRRKQIK